MSGHDDFAFEPIPGLPERPPAGEEVLWQGRPNTWALARDAFKLHWIAFYFVLLIVWRTSVGYSMGGVGTAVALGLPHLGLAIAGCAVVWALAWAQARTTMYTITTARVVMRIGAALSVTFNLPFTQIGAASLDLRKSGIGTIALQTLGDTRIAYLVAWPHVRPWHFGKTQPALRSIPDAARVARVLADAAQARMSIPVVTRVEPGAMSGNAVPAE